MNDNNFIKALTSCARQYSCLKCPLYKHEIRGNCIKSMLTNALDLINRQKAEIEELKEENQGLKQELSYAPKYGTIGDQK